MKKIVITGPESAGKTQLTRKLADYYHCNWIPEFARSYIESLDRKYTYYDVEIIAQHQWSQYIETLIHNTEKAPFIFFDTWLIITKIWFIEVYEKFPDWIDSCIQKAEIDLFLLCKPDLPWEFDPVRENPHRREYLFERYKSEIETFGFNYQIISGIGHKRLDNAVMAIEAFQL